jgi:hypothetical protein
LHVADAAATEAPTARDVDDAAPKVVDSRGPFGGNLGWKSGCRVSLSSKRLWSGYVMPLILVSGIKEAEPYLVKQLLYSGIVKDLGFTLKAACHPPPNSAGGEMESGLRPYDKRALSISAPSNEHNA